MGGLGSVTNTEQTDRTPETVTARPGAVVTPVPVVPPPPWRIEGQIDDLERAEYDFVLRLFDDLKRAGGDAEMKVSINIDARTGRAEIIHGSILKKRSIDPLRLMYRARANGARR